MIDTRGPFYAAYTLTAVLYAGYMLTLWRRARRLRQRLDDSVRAPRHPE